MVYLNLRRKPWILAGDVPDDVRRIFEIPDFRFYAQAEGIERICSAQRKAWTDVFLSVIRGRT